MFQKIDKDKQERYIIVSQVISFILLAMVILTAISYKGHTFDELGYRHSIIMFMILIPLIVVTRFISIRTSTLNFESFLNVFFLVVSAIFLIYLDDPSFKILLIMPIILSAARSGIRPAIYTCSLSLIVLFYISYKNDFQTIDSDLMYTIVFILVAWLLGNMRETENDIRQKLEKLASHDGLTDLYNHRSFHYLLDQELDRAGRDNQALSLLLLDIDYFKVYNDSFGHPKGDLVLKQVAGILHASTPSGGYCARYGGEEFALILPDTGIKDAVTVGERIRSKIEETAFPGMEVLPKGKLTVSIGIAEYPSMAGGKEKLIQKADEALYKAKFISKNKVEAYYSVFDELSLTLADEEKGIFNSIRTLTMVINAKDKYTYGHSERSMQLAGKFAARVNMSEESTKNLIYSALLHDIGKIEISREILNKPAKLNESEWEILKCHPQWGAEIIRPLKSFEGVVEIVLHHHENYDGTGYPHGLKGTEIPFGARVLRIIDSFDAITTNRHYKPAMNKEQAIEEMKRFSGKHYDPSILEQFADMILDGSYSLEFYSEY